MDRAQKAASIEELKSVFADHATVVVTQYTGMTFVEMSELRNRLRKEGAVVKVFKNRLAQKALDGKVGEKGDALFKGPVALVYSADPVTAAKISVQYAKENDKLKIIGGIMDTEVLNEAGVKSLATLPSIDELRGKLLGLLQAPATKIAGVLQAPAGAVARVIGAHARANA
ncbi:MULTISPECIES: 50S ribosomal protein L10 [Asticcacaulis]|uniref:50S ribosomal protein L10 n=1 Tax=Asticcacaulis TaxID=76890 RepID=UPI001AE99F65|nr:MULTISPECIES: 50S ribosomal protein L10 [Asticcacaulis]MBP2158448.1 large subunit ribosomal protein L10 [Asticcacaulis solisilvae]MDR6799493.1 large subunit ribosomal protein L10 [Asticcacaulis sp. BE141]